MKNILIQFSLFIIFLYSCSKSNDTNTSSSITGSIDGIGVSFNNNVKVIHTDAGGAYSISIIGFQGTGTSNQVALSITSNHPVAAGTYTENGSTGSNIGTVGYIQAGNPYPYVNNTSQSNPATITITAISTTSIQGSFSGDVYLTNSSGITNTKKAITKGQFNVSF